jgi:hemerythrin
MYIAWDQKYATGIRAIDNDHKFLFTLANELHASLEEHGRNSIEDIDSNPHEIGLALANLQHYAEEHFAREERFLLDGLYPDTMAHIAKHRNFKNTVLALRKIHREHPSQIDPQKLSDYLADWLTGHILKADRDFVPYLTGEILPPIDVLAGLEQRTMEPPSATVDLPGPLLKLTLNVPSHAVETLRCCATLLKQGGEGAANLTAIVQSVDAISYEDAQASVGHLLR